LCEVVRSARAAVGGRLTVHMMSKNSSLPSLPCAKPSTLRGPWHHMGAAADEREHEQQPVRKYAQASYWHHMGAAA
jgi:hypothetical protein